MHAEIPVKDLHLKCYKYVDGFFAKLTEPIFRADDAKRKASTSRNA